MQSEGGGAPTRQRAESAHSRRSMFDQSPQQDNGDRQGVNFDPGMGGSGDYFEDKQGGGSGGGASPAQQGGNSGWNILNSVHAASMAAKEEE